MDKELRGFLSRSYNFKTVADDMTALNLDIPHDKALAAVAEPERFVAMPQHMIDLAT